MESEGFSYLNAIVLENLSKDDDHFLEISNEIGRDIATKKLTVLEVIKKLGCLLTNQSFSKREVGVLILGESLQKISLEHEKNIVFSSEELTVLSSYLTEKLKEHHQVAISALKGAYALVSFPNIPSESVINLVSSIFNHMTCQQQQQQDRYLIFQIYETVLKKYPKAVESMGIDFVYGIISSIDGERDPKNLIYLFDWLQVFLKSVKLEHLTEEMFDVLACYFPVDFKAPPSDRIKITREDLATRLCQCLTCIPDFGLPGLTLALEKLDSALKIAKEDSLDLLKIGCKSYDPSVYHNHSVEIWSQIQKEIFNTTDEDFKQKCLDTLKEIFKKISQGEPNKFEKIVLDVSDTLKGNLLPDSKLFTQSTQILVSVAQASEKSSIIIAKKVAPLLDNTFKITHNPEQKSVILRSLLAFVQAVIDNNNNIDISSIEEIRNAPMLCLQAILDINEHLRIEGFKGFTAIAQFLPENEQKLLFTNLHTFIVTSQKAVVKDYLFRCLKKYSEIFPQKIEEQVLYKEKINDIIALDLYLESLTYLVELKYFEDYVMNTLLKYSLDNNNNSEVALRHLNNVLIKYTGVDNILIKHNFITHFIDFLMNLDNFQNDFLNCVSLVLQGTIRNQENTLQKQVYASESVKKFKSERMFVAVLHGLIISLKKGIFEDFDKCYYLLDCILTSEDHFVQDTSLEILANILNKVDNADILEVILNKISSLCDNCSNPESKIGVISWVTKSLVTRNHPVAWQWTDKLISCLDENVEASKGFQIVMDESNPALSIQNHCQIMPLYKQKFFVYVTNKISEDIQISKTQYFTVTGYLLVNTPKQAIIGQFRKIIRLILLCLEKSKNDKVLQTIVQKICDFVVSGESVIEDSMEDIFLRILNLTTFEESMGVRIAAIKCIQQFALTYPVYKMLPYQKKVIGQLGLCVDDKKRLVRREAMTCRSLWYLLDAPE